jgi:ubiquinone/menaquinone biosynthesis C-methylase UbiE
MKLEIFVSRWNGVTRRSTIRRIVDWFQPSFPSQRVSSHTPWQHWYLRPLVDLGTIGGEHLQGIFSPLYEEASIQRYIHSQFREQAETYAEKYTAIDYFTRLLSDAFAKIHWEGQHTGCAILDIGSGAGNSIFPLLHLCLNALVIASDLSLELLVLLKQKLREQGLEQRCALLQLNAEELDFAPESFDLVVGAAVLHHLLAPDRTINGCARILKPGGYAIFFEPFENGHAILSLIYEVILQRAHQEPLAPEVEASLRSLVHEYAARKGREKSSPLLGQMDDKWLFTKSYIEEMAEKAGFSQCRIYPLHALDQQFANQIEVNLRLGCGKGREVLPQWAWEMVQHYEEHFSPDCKRDLLIEGGVILRK